MKIRLAKLISNVVNPFLVTFAVIILISFECTASTGDAIKWLSIAIALSVLPVFIVILVLVRVGKLDGLFINSQRQRKKVYALVIFWGIVSCVILGYIGVPRMLLAIFVAGLSAIIIFMGINFLWKISLHTAFITGAVTILTLVYGAIGAISVVLVPLVAWARIKQKHHSLAQSAVGAVLAALVVVLVFRLFSLV